MCPRIGALLCKMRRSARSYVTKVMIKEITRLSKPNNGESCSGGVDAITGLMKALFDCIVICKQYQTDAK